MKYPKVSHEIADHGKNDAGLPESKPEIPDASLEPRLDIFPSSPTSSTRRGIREITRNPWPGWRSPDSSPRPNEKRN